MPPSGCSVIFLIQVWSAGSVIFKHTLLATVTLLLMLPSTVAVASSHMVGWLGAPPCPALPATPPAPALLLPPLLLVPPLPAVPAFPPEAVLLVPLAPPVPP